VEIWTSYKWVGKAIQTRLRYPTTNVLDFSSIIGGISDQSGIRNRNQCSHRKCTAVSMTCPFHNKDGLVLLRRTSHGNLFPLLHQWLPDTHRRFASGFFPWCKTKDDRTNAKKNLLYHRSASLTILCANRKPSASNRPVGSILGILSYPLNMPIGESWVHKKVLLFDFSRQYIIRRKLKMSVYLRCLRPFWSVSRAWNFI
jgi:hypothetical protein